MMKLAASLSGTLTVLLAAGISAMALAATTREPVRAVSVRGMVERVNIGSKVEKKGLAVVTSEGQFYLLRPSAAHPAAYAVAKKDVGRNEWFNVRGMLGHRHGVPSVSVESIVKG